MKKQKQSSTPPTQSVPDRTGEKQALQTYTAQEVKESVLKMSITGAVDHALHKLGNGLLSKWSQGPLEERRKVEKEFQEQASAVMYGFETDSHITMMEGFSERFRGGAKEICKQFIQDFDCKNSAEKILAETAAIAFMRYLDGSRRLNGCMDIAEYISDERTRYLAYLSKQMDRSHRQYLSTLLTLKQLKAPTIEMNIRAKTAFVSQNQQINASTNETNEPK